jgi:hypothetical protein
MAKSKNGKKASVSLHTTSGTVGNPRVSCFKSSGHYPTWTVTVTTTAILGGTLPPDSEAVESIVATVKDGTGNPIILLTNFVATGIPNEYAQTQPGLGSKPATVDVTTTFITRNLMKRTANCGCPS